MDPTAFDPILMVAIVFVVIGGLFAGYGIYRLRQGRRQRTWPTVQGVVESTSVVREHQTRRDRGEAVSYYPRIVYNYVIDGQTHNGNTLGAIRTTGTTKGRAERAAAAYQVGGPVTVHYDPADPTKSAVNPGSAGCQTVFMIALGTLIFVLGAGLLYVVLVAS